MEKKQYLLLKFVTLICLPAICSGKLNNYDSITINGLNEGSQTFQGGESLELTCEANFPIQWKNPNNSEYVGWLDPLKTRRMSLSQLSTDMDGKYRRTITITNLNHADTGNYYCYDMDNPTKRANHYVFVEDQNSDNIFLHWVDGKSRYSHLISFYENAESYIDCLVTHPDASVTISIGTRSKIDSLTPNYDPTKGFHITPFQLSELDLLQGAVSSCKATLPDGRFDEIYFLLLGLKAADKTNITLKLNDTGAQHAYKGGDLNLECSASITEQSFTLACNWQFPAQKESASSRITIIKTAESSTSFTTRLIISPLQMTDKGNYTCICESQGSKQTDSTQVSISETMGQIKVLSVISPNMNLDTGDKAEFGLRFTIWPEPMEYKWIHAFTSPIYGDKNQTVNPNDKRISVLPTQIHRPLRKWRSLDDSSFTEGAIRTQKLQINNAAATDSGKYILGITVADATFPYTFNLLVKSKQLSSELRVSSDYNGKIEVDRRFLQLGNHYNIFCLGTGVPLPQIRLQWKPCVRSELCNWIDVTSRGTILDGTFQRLLRTREKAEQTGTYNCISESASLSPVSVIKEMIVTDVNDSEANKGMALQIFHKPRGEDGRKNTIYEYDGYSMDCNVQKYDYRQVRWFKEAKDKNGNVIDYLLGDDISSVPGYDITWDETSFSAKLILNFYRIKTNDSGLYKCTANLGSDPNEKVRIQQIDVIKTEGPTFSNLTTQYSVTANYSQPFQLRCIVHGIPQPSVVWYKDGKKFTLPSYIVASKNGTVLTINRVVAEDKGVYMCRARNRVGMVSKTITLKVAGAPGHAPLSTTGIAILSTCLGFAALIVLVLLSFVCHLKRKERQNRAELKDLYDELMESAKTAERGSDYGMKLDPNRPVNGQTESLPYDRQFELSRSWLKVDKLLGEGQFGRVLSGSLKIPPGDEQRYSALPDENLSDGEEMEVAIKMPRNGRSQVHQRALIDELKIMIHIGRHPNVLGLIGAITKQMVKGELYVVVELCSLGSLQDYLRSHRATFVTEIVPRSPSSPPPPSPMTTDGYVLPNHLQERYHFNNATKSFTSYQGDFDPRWVQELNENRLTRSFLSTSDLLSFSYQTANGMDFLASKNLIHRDLATRNLLLTENQQVKIADFGLARQDQTYHIQKSKNVPLPIKWMALESIVYQDFTVKSDIWSFGVVLWEIFSLGETPYPSQPLDYSFVTFLKEGNRMEQPRYAPQEIFALMRLCWDTEPENRPDFKMARDIVSSELKRCSPQLFEQMIGLGDLPCTSDVDSDVYEEPNSGRMSKASTNKPVYYNRDAFQDLTSPSHNLAARNLNPQKRLQGFSQIPQDDPDSPRLNPSIENQSYMMGSLDPKASRNNAQSSHTGAQK